jgi:esterase
MTDPVPDEFAMLQENATEAGLTWREPAVSRVDQRVGEQTVSAIVWGATPPGLVLLHGGGQNAHTWDTVVLLLLDRFPDLGVVAVDLPGHGRSDWRDDHAYSPRTHAAAVAPVLEALAPEAAAVVGMSLGGMTTIRLAATEPALVRRAVLVDVTPASGERAQAMTNAQRGTVALVSGPPGYDTFDEMLAATVAAAPPTRARSALRRGVIHNATRDADGRWVWRYDRNRPAGDTGDLVDLWADLSRAPAPFTLVRGGDSAFVSDSDAAEFSRRRPEADVHVVPGSGHSVQSDQPAALVEIIAGVLAPTG